MTTLERDDRTGVYGWYVTVVLMLCGALSYIDSSLPFILVEAIKADLKLTDTEVGLITGPAFSLTYAVCALPIAKISDRHGRKRVICVAIIVWSAITAAAGLARGFATFALSRAGVALGESSLTPAANSIIADNIAPATRPIAIALFYVGTPIGMALALALGGVINDHYGWRTAFFLVGGSGVFLTLLVALTVREPPRRRDHARYDLPKGNLRSLLRDAAFRNIVIGATLTAFSVGAVTGWGPAYAMRTFHLGAARVGPILGGALGLFSVAGMLAGGFAASWLAKFRPGHGFRMVAIALTIATVTQFAALLAPDFGLFVLLAGVSQFLVSFYSAPTMAAVASLVEPGARSFAAAVTVFCMSGIGLASSTFLTGALSDLLRPRFGTESLHWALFAPVVARLCAVIYYCLAAKAVDRPEPV